MAKAGNILVVGSVGLDMIFSVRGTIQEKIHAPGGKIGKQNLMFRANAKNEFYGGTGGNISYGLGLLGVKPMLFSLAGADFTVDYAKHLLKKSVDLRVLIDKTGWTANFYGITDGIGEQIGMWQPNAYENIAKTSLIKKVSKKELATVAVAIFSPGTPESMHVHMREFRKYNQNAIVIFDPGQEIGHFSKKLLTNCFDLCDIFIGNEVEYAQTEKILGKNLRAFLAAQEIIGIETVGAKGSKIYDGSKSVSVPAVKLKKLADPTGAGDAYRAGLIFGITKGLSLTDACGIGSQMASQNIAHLGCQKYLLP